MKPRQLKQGIFMLIVALVALFLGVRYQRVNADTKQQLKTVQIYHDQAIEAKGVTFSFSNLHVQREGSNDILTVRMTIQQSMALPYGDRRANRNFWENIRLVVPYRYLGIAQLQAYDGSRSVYRQLTNSSPHVVRLKFSLPLAQYDKCNGNPYLLFMVPNDDGYTRYKLFV